MGKTAIMSAQTLNKAFVYLPGGGTAIYNSSGPVYYRHPDWLGTSRLTSTPSRTAYAASAYAPYGEQYDKAGSSDPSFTGHDEGTTNTLYDFPFREYSASQGRWTSPDPAGIVAVDPINPQSWNRYAYALSDPLALIDPSGTCSQVSYQSTVFPDGTVQVTNVQTEFLYPGPCDNPCGPGEGWAIVQGYAVCGPPGNLGTILTQVQGIFDSAGPFFGVGGGIPQMPSCTALQAEASKLASFFESVSSTSGWTAFGAGAGTLLAGLGEVPTAGLDTPGTITLAATTDFFGTVSVVSGGVAAALNSYASGNASAMWNFNVSQLANLAAKAAASKIPGIKPWAERIGDLAEQASDLALKANEGCR